MGHDIDSRHGTREVIPEIAGKIFPAHTEHIAPSGSAAREVLLVQPCLENLINLTLVVSSLSSSLGFTGAPRCWGTID
jgi:hypothetical protein